MECEFANIGCDVKVPRRDLTRHMTENAQHHLMSAALLNLRLTKELHQKMEEKDQQITELQQQINNLDTKLEDQVRNLDEKIETKFQELQEQNQDLKAMIETNEIIKQLEKSITPLQILRAKEFTSHNFNFTKFSKQEFWMSDMTKNHPSGIHFQFLVCKERHLTAMLRFDSKQEDGIKCTVYLQMLNQLGDHGHCVKRDCQIISSQNMLIGSDGKTFPLASLKYSADTKTQYLKNDCLKFRLFLKIERE